MLSLGKKRSRLGSRSRGKEGDPLSHGNKSVGRRGDGKCTVAERGGPHPMRVALRARAAGNRQEATENGLAADGRRKHHWENQFCSSVSLVRGQRVGFNVNEFTGDPRTCWEDGVNSAIKVASLVSLHACTIARQSDDCLALLQQMHLTLRFGFGHVESTRGLKKYKRKFGGE